MDSSAKPTRSTAFLLAGLIVLAATLGFFAALVPLVPCPTCHGRPRILQLKGGLQIETTQIIDDLQSPWIFYQGQDRARHRVARLDVVGFRICERCRGMSKVSLANKLIRRD